MKSMKTILIIALFLIGCAFNADAQKKTKPERTSSAKAYYGTQGKPKVDLNKKKKNRRNSGAKAIRQERGNRKKYSRS